MTTLARRLVGYMYDCEGRFEDKDIQGTMRWWRYKASCPIVFLCGFVVDIALLAYRDRFISTGFVRFVPYDFHCLHYSLRVFVVDSATMLETIVL
jgi:hypothetical protein